MITLETERMWLMALGREQLNLCLSDIPALGQALNLDIAADAFSEESRQAMAIKITRMLLTTPQTYAWYTYFLLVRKGDRRVMGVCGFKGAPNPFGSVELGYGIHENYRNQGYMTETVRALVVWAFDHPACLEVTAETLKDNLPSQKVLQKAGLRFYHATDKMKYWRVLKKQAIQMKAKADLPLETFGGKSFSGVMQAYMEINHLKQLYRQGWLKRGVPAEQCESVADHVFGMAMLAWWVADDHFPGLDQGKILRMVLLHELGEVYVGDLTPADGVSMPEKHRQEEAAFGQIVNKLPRAAEYEAIWQEFEDGLTPEARFVKQMDRLEMACQAAVYQQQGFSGMDEFFITAQQSLFDPAIKEIFREVYP